MNQSPLKYLESAVFARELGDEMLSRLDWMTIKPEVVVEVGCGPGGMLEALHRRYPTARLIALDHSVAMVQHVKDTYAFCEAHVVDAAELQLASSSVDLLIANLVLPWHGNVVQLLREWRRVLRPNGLLMFTALGPETMAEWQTLFQRYDMHDLGDAMMQAGFADPVLDVNHFTLTYREIETLHQELQASEMIAADQSVPDDIKRVDDRMEVYFEAIIAHAFTPIQTDVQTKDEDGTVRVPLSALREKLRGAN